MLRFVQFDAGGQTQGFAHGKQTTEVYPISWGDLCKGLVQPFPAQTLSLGFWSACCI